MVKATPKCWRWDIKCRYGAKGGEVCARRGAWHRSMAALDLEPDLNMDPQTGPASSFTTRQVYPATPGSFIPAWLGGT